MKKRQPERQIHNSIMDYLFAVHRKDFTFFTFDRKGGYDPVSGAFRKILRHGEDPAMSPLDIVGWHHGTGRILWLEVKRVTWGKPNKNGACKMKKTQCSDGQILFQVHCNKTNAFNCVVYGINDAEQAIIEFKRLYNNNVVK